MPVSRPTAQMLTVAILSAPLALVWAGCTAPHAAPSPAAMQGHAPMTTTDPLAQRAEDLEKAMLIGPVAARSLGLHPTWSASFVADGGVSRLWSTDSGVFVLDGRNELTLLDATTGLRKWRGFVADPGDRVLDLHVAADAGMVMVLRSDALVTLDLTTGFPKGSLEGAVRPIQRLQWLARTGGQISGPEFIYGGIGGEIVWQSWVQGLSTRAHRIGRRITVAPALAGDVIIASSVDGVVSALDARSGALLWARTLLDEAGARPVCDESHVWVSGLDQHLRCLTIANEGRPLWSAILEAPLLSSPTLIGDRVYQQVPGTGLTAWEAAPENSPNGVQVWTAPGITGDVLGTSGNSLLTWQGADGALAMVSPSTGSLDIKLNLPSGTRLQMSSTGSGRVFVISDQGRIESLVPSS